MLSARYILCACSVGGRGRAGRGRAQATGISVRATYSHTHSAPSHDRPQRSARAAHTRPRPGPCVPCPRTSSSILSYLARDESAESRHVRQQPRGVCTGNNGACHYHSFILRTAGGHRYSQLTTTQVAQRARGCCPPRPLRAGRPPRPRPSACYPRAPRAAGVPISATRLPPLRYPAPALHARARAPCRRPPRARPPSPPFACTRVASIVPP